MKFKDIEQIPKAYYSVDLPWSDINYNIDRYVKEYGLNLDPDFQRGYVWSLEQKVAYLEWGFRGGRSGMDIFVNHPGWMGSFEGMMLLIDGKQRLSSVMEFLDNKIPVFNNHYFKDFEDQMHSMNPSFTFHVFKMQTKKEILKWYIAMNSGGSIHTKKEIDRVRGLLKEEGD